MLENIRKKWQEKQVLYYKIRLYLIQILFFVLLVFCGYFFFGDFSEQPVIEEKTEEYEDAGMIEDETTLTDEQEAFELPVYSDEDLKKQIADIMKNTADEFISKQDEPDEKNVPLLDIRESAEKIPDSKASLPDNKFYIAIVIDDMGISQERTKDIINIKSPLTTSFLTYGKNLDELTAKANENGHEVIIHIPMEPYAATNTAPEQLLVSMGDAEIKAVLNSQIDKIKVLRGGNNHMGSKFTENREKMSVVMEVLRERNMFFLDSKTSAKAIGCEVAEKYGVACANRDVFLDNENDYAYIMGQLKRTERIAAKKGYAIAIGHPKSQTAKALSDWLKDIDRDRFEVVHLSDLLKTKKILTNSENDI